jgi:GGDEF domain-containing protein
MTPQTVSSIVTTPTPLLDEVLKRVAQKANVSIAAVRTFARISAAENIALFSAEAAQNAFSRVKVGSCR